MTYYAWCPKNQGPSHDCDNQTNPFRSRTAALAAIPYPTNDQIIINPYWHPRPHRPDGCHFDRVTPGPEGGLTHVITGQFPSTHWGTDGKRLERENWRCSVHGVKPDLFMRHGTYYNRNDRMLDNYYQQESVDLADPSIAHSIHPNLRRWIETNDNRWRLTVTIFYVRRPAPLTTHDRW